jgi:hypothetical protein
MQAIGKMIAILFIATQAYSAERIMPPLGYLNGVINKNITPSSENCNPLTHNQLMTYTESVWWALDFKADDTENWTETPSGMGDCEDYALKLRKILIDANISNQYFSLAVVDGDVEGINHAVLIVTTSDRGRFMFDNKGLHSMNKYKLLKIEQNGWWYK